MTIRALKLQGWHKTLVKHQLIFPHYDMDVLLACQEFHLLSWAGMLQPPPAMVRSIQQFVMGTYAHQFLQQFDFDWQQRQIKWPELSDAEQTDFNVIRHVLERMEQQRTQAGVTRLTLTKCFVDFDFAGWHCPYGPAAVVQAMLAAESLTGITVEVRFGQHTEGHKALWFGSQWNMKLFLPLPECPTLADYKRKIINLDRVELDVHDTIEHELIHMVQQMGPYIKNMKQDLTGMPPKKVRAPEYTPSGWQREDVKFQGTRRLHSLHDAEFYTNLHDSLNLYLRHREVVPPEWQEEFLRVFLGAKEKEKSEVYPRKLRLIILPDYFFMTLKLHDPKRWQEAVKRFLTAIQES